MCVDKLAMFLARYFSESIVYDVIDTHESLKDSALGLQYFLRGGYGQIAMKILKDLKQMCNDDGKVWSSQGIPKQGGDNRVRVNYQETVENGNDRRRGRGDNGGQQRGRSGRGRGRGGRLFFRRSLGLFESTPFIDVTLGEFTTPKK